MKSFYVGKRDGSICKINTKDYSKSVEIAKLQSEPLQIRKGRAGKIIFAITDAKQDETYESSLWLIDQHIHKDAKEKNKKKLIDQIGNKLFDMVKKQREKLKVDHAKTILLR